MLTISKSLSAGQAQSYHKLEFTSETQNYYKQCKAVKGEWQGKLAAGLGLSGEVAPQEFARLTEGKHPQTEAELVRHRAAMEYANPDGTTTKAVEHRAGWDATFSAPKSVSLTALVGGDEQVREAHRAAVSTALNELERYAQARIGGNNPAETTGRFIAAKFEHDTSRPVEGYAAPQLHTHAVIFNVTERTNGSTRALEPKSLFDSQNFATAVYQSAFTYELRNRGYEIEAGKSGAPEIKGYSEAYLEASSPRSQQIREQLEKNGYSGPEAAQNAAHSTRERKQTLTPEEVLAAHKTMAAEYGNQPERIVAEARERARSQQGRDLSDLRQRAKEAVTCARASIYEREAVADERTVMRDALRRGMGETIYADVRAEFYARERRGDFQQVIGNKYDTGRRFTTPETVAQERANILTVLKGRNTVEPMMSHEAAETHAKTRDFLNDRQRAVIADVLNTTDRVHGLQGLAGSGKTTALAAIREGAERSGYAVEGFAPSSKAAGQLREAGISAATLQSFLARGDTGPADPASRHLYLLDESSLASTRQMRSFLDKVGPEDRVLVIGDTRQHQAVDAGKPFEQMRDAGMRTSQLDTIVRQKYPELLKAVQHLATGETEKGIALLAEQGRVTQIANGNDRITAIAKDYAANPKKTLIVSPDNRSRQQINEAVRAELVENGTLGKERHSFLTLAHRSDMTGADRTWAARYNPGDVLQYTTGSKANGIERNSFATVRDVDARANTLTVELENGASGTLLTYDPRRLRGVNAYREIAREFATGDRLQFGGAEKTLGVNNRDLGTVTRIEESRITVALDGKTPRSVTFYSKDFRHFDHGYAVTSHSSQGLTAGRIIANIDTESSRSLINARLAYVAITRASEDARIYTNDAETLGKRLATDVSKTAAMSFHRPESKREQKDKPAPQPHSLTWPEHVEVSRAAEEARLADEHCFRSSVEQTRRAIAAFRSNDPYRATEILQSQGRVHEYAHPDHRLVAVALDYAASPERAIVVAPAAIDREELNAIIRGDLQGKGKIATEGRTVPVLVEQELGNPRLAASYSPGDTIRYKTGSPREHGIADNSTTTVFFIDKTKNLLTVETAGWETVTYNPALLKRQTNESTVYRSEEREMANGERIRFTAPNPGQGIRDGDLATVVGYDEEKGMTVKLDKGRTVEIGTDYARHIDHGYTVESARNASADRVLLTGDRSQVVGQQAALTRLSPYVREFAIYTSDGRQPFQQQQTALPAPQREFSTQRGIEPSLAKLPEAPVPEVEYTGHSISR